MHSVDRISELPDDILSSVLFFLSMRDAVKTRVLSQRWRYLSASTSNLHFDLYTVLGINYSRKSYMFSNISNDYIWGRFVRAVDQCLQLCKTPKVYSFKVCYCLGNDSARDIDRWITFAVRMQIEKLDIDLSCTHIRCELYNFPCHLLPQGEASKIKNLSLRSCVLRPSPGLKNIFNSLKTLDLNNVSFDQSVFNGILSDCINLEGLRLKNCRLPVSVLVCGQLLCLKSLVLDNCHGAEKIELSSIDLNTFEYTGKMTNLSFVGVSFVEKVYLRLDYPFERGTNYMFKGLPKELPRLQILSLFLYTPEIRPIPINMNKFHHLKELELLVYLYSKFDLFSVVLILNASPCLQKFHLSLRHANSRRPMVEKEYPKQLYYELKQVEISGFVDRCNSLELARYLLNSAVGLERMTIDFEKRWDFGPYKWIRSCSPLSNEPSEKKRVHDVLSVENPNVELNIL